MPVPAKRKPETRTDVSVVIPVRNGASTIAQCLAALAEQTIRPGEVIVVDDGSTDDTPDIARRFGAEVLTQDHAGAGAARNRGARAAHGDLLLFTDADCAPVADWVERLVETLDGDGVAAARGVTTSDQPEPAARFAQLEYDEKYRQLARHESVELVATYSAAYRRDAFWRFGGFDEGFSGATSEDQELSFRLADAGLKIAFVPGAAVRHHHHTSLRAYVRRKFWIGYAKARIGRHHPDKLIHDTYTPQSLKLQVGFAGVMALGLVVAPVRRGGLAVAATGAMGFAASSIPFVRFGRSREPDLTDRLPAYLAARALALGAGLAMGTLAELRGALH
jgi:glycosyltransferase involved in cell wall biosynthesis